MAKLFCTEVRFSIAMWATETFGARDVIESLPISHYTLDAKAALIGEGPPGVQKKIIAGHSEELLESL